MLEMIVEGRWRSDSDPGLTLILPCLLLFSLSLVVQGIVIGSGGCGVYKPIKIVDKKETDVSEHISDDVCVFTENTDVIESIRRETAGKEGNSRINPRLRRPRDMQ